MVARRWSWGKPKLIAAWNQQGRVMASYRDASGVLSIRDIGEAEYAAYVRDPKYLKHLQGITDIRRDFPGWHKALFVDYDSRKRALEPNQDVLFEADVSPVRRFLSDHNCKIDPPRRAYLDIETDSRTPFSEATVTGTRLLSFAIVDEEGNKYTAVLEDDDDQAEAELWAEMWRIMSGYDQIAAWNGDGFDFEVMKIQCEKLARSFKNILDVYWEHRRRLLFIDHLACFKRHHMAAESGDDKTSFALNAVCEALIGEGKTDFESGKTWEAWAEGGAERQRLVAYNLQDTALLPKLEAETGYLALQQTLAELSFTFANSHGLKPSPQFDGYMLRMAHRRQTHLPSKKQPTGNEKPYDGAIVLPPQGLGIHRTVHVCDFKSLYPTVVRTFNISPETKGGELDPSIAFGTEVPFDNTIVGMFPQAMEDAMRLRDHYKKEYKADPNNKPAERKSKAYKIFANSGYGWLGNVYGRFYDPQLAESITLSAKHLAEKVFEAVRARGWVVLYADTDSAFVTGCTVEEFKDFVRWCNEEYFPKILDDRGCPREQQCIALDYEKCFDRLIFPLGNDGTPTKKRYLGSYLHYAFKPKDKPEIAGLEYKRADSIRYTRRLQKQVVDMLLSGVDDPEQVEEWVKRQRELFFEAEIDPDDIVKSASISQDLDAYKTNTPHVRVAREMQERGEDVSEGTRIGFVVVDGQVSPSKVISVSEFDGKTFDRIFYWSKSIYPAIKRVLAGAFPDRPWHRWTAKYPKVKVLPGQLSLL